MIRAWARASFRAFSNRGFLVLWIGSTLAWLAFGMSWVVQSVVAFELTGRNSAVGIVGVGMGVSALFVGPFGGVIADRLRKRPLLLVGQSLIGAVFFTVGVLVVTDRITIFWLVMSTFSMGLIFSFIGPARQAWVGELLEGRMLANGVALAQMGMAITRVLGPFVAGAMIALPWAGAGGAYFLMAGMFVVVVATLWQVPGGMTPGAKEGQSVFGDFLAGIRHLVERPQLLLLSLGFMGFVIAGFSYQVVVPAFVELELGRDQGTVGLLYGVSGIAGLAVSVGIAGVAGSKHAFVTMTAAGVVVAVGLALFAVAGTLWLAAFALVVVGAGSSGYQLLQNALLMEAAAPEYYGRVMSVVMLAWGVNGLVAWPFGALADAIGERETLAVMAALTLLVQAAVIAGHTTVGRRGAVAGQPAVDFAGPGNDA